MVLITPITLSKPLVKKNAAHWQLPQEYQVNKVPDLSSKLETFLPTLEHHSAQPYNISRRKAIDYMADQKEGSVGTLARCKQVDVKDLHMNCKNVTLTNPSPIVHSLFGAPGSCKSTSLQKFLVQEKVFESGSLVSVICPRVTQLLDWRNAVKPSFDYLIKTFETPFRQPVNDVVIIEELSQTPPGWFDAFLILNQHLRVIVVLGDPRQNTEYIRNSAALTRHHPPNIVEINKPIRAYCNKSYRLPRNLCSEISIQCMVPSRPNFFVRFTNHLDMTERGHPLPILTPKETRAAHLINSGHAQVFTYTSAQGSDFKDPNGRSLPYILELDNNCLAMSENTWFTAITRSSIGIYLYREDSVWDKLPRRAEKCPSLRALLRLHESTSEAEVFTVTKNCATTKNELLRLLLLERPCSDVTRMFNEFFEDVQSSPESFPRSHYPNFQDKPTNRTFFVTFTRSEVRDIIDWLQLPWHVAGHGRARAHQRTIRLVKNVWIVPPPPVLAEQYHEKFESTFN